MIMRRTLDNAILAMVLLAGVAAFPSVPPCAAAPLLARQSDPVSPALRQALGAEWLSDDERRDLRVRHGLWEEGDLDSPARRARAALDDLLAPGNRVTCRVAKFDRYCRYVAQCVAADGATDLGAGMLTAGQAYGYWLEDTLPWAPAAGQAYIALERAARAERRGLWADVLGKR